MFRFTIRDVLWLTVVVALAVGWWYEHNRAAIQQRSAQKWRENALYLHQTYYNETSYSLELRDANGVVVKSASTTDVPKSRLLKAAVQ